MISIQFLHVALFVDGSSGRVLFPADGNHRAQITIPSKGIDEPLAGLATLKAYDAGNSVVTQATSWSTTARVPSLNDIAGTGALAAMSASDAVTSGAASAALELPGGELSGQRGRTVHLTDEAYLDVYWDFGTGKSKQLTNYVTWAIDPASAANTGLRFELAFNTTTVTLADGDDVFIHNTDAAGAATIESDGNIYLHDYVLLYNLLDTAVVTAMNKVDLTPRTPALGPLTAAVGWKIGMTLTLNPERPLCPVGRP